MIKFETINGTLCRMVEPKPLLADAKVGDLCKRMDGKWVQIETLCSLGGMPWICYEIGGLRYINNGEQLNTKDRNLDIIHTEPLAPEETKEWALQMMKMGKCVCHVKAPSIKYHRPTHYVKRVVRENCTDDMSDAVWMKGADPTGWQLYEEPKPEPKERPLRNLILRAKEQGMNIRTWYQDLIFTPESLTSYLNNGEYRWYNTGDWELTKREANMPMPEPEPPREPEYVTCKRCGGTGYEIKPEPAKEQFEVGDWVEFIDVGGRKSQGKYLSNTDGNSIIVLDTACNMRVVVHTTKIIRKLKPSEVEVDFGFAKGRILSRTSGDVKVLNNKSIVIATIIVSEITNPATRELVESLLKAQEEHND